MAKVRSPRQEGEDMHSTVNGIRMSYEDKGKGTATKLMAEEIHHADNVATLEYPDSVNGVMKDFH